MGGGTGMIGDPSDKSDMRQLLTIEKIDHYLKCIKEQMAKFLDFSEEKAVMVNNADWLLGLNYIEFLREYGTMFSVNRMLSAECYKSRLEQGLTFLEFNYMILQSYDYLELHKRYNCNLQLGGNDQWSNILSGTELIRRKVGADAHALTIPLLLNNDGSKMGKTVKGAVWLDPDKTSPFEFYQYWRNVADADVINYLKMLTFLPLDLIWEMDTWSGEKLNGAKETLAFELTSLIHGVDIAETVHDASKELFKTGGAANMPSMHLVKTDFADGTIDILSLLVKAELCASKGDARRNIDQGGVEVDGKQIRSTLTTFDYDDFKDEGIIIRKGKKTFCRVALV
jgi:tyrosyl-tRNA synthetase